jgi:dCTP diphosphatase
MEDQLEIIRRKLLQFRDERDWAQFHDPKNLAEAISIESGELLERFLWLSSDQSKFPDERRLEGISEEIADIMIYLIYLCNELNINLLSVVDLKIKSNAFKYPIVKAKGSSKKYEE